MSRQRTALFDPPGPAAGEPPLARSSIAAQQVCALDHGLIAAASSVPIAALSAYVLEGELPGQTLVAWVLAVAAIVGGRILIAAGLRRCAPNPTRDLLIHTIGAGLAGSAWGLLAIFFINTGTVAEHAFLGFVIAGVTVGALSTLSWHLPAYLGFLLAATLPLVATYLSDFDRLSRVMGALVLLYSALMALAARYFNGRILAVLRLQDEVAALGRTLTASEAELAQAERNKWKMLGHLSHELRTPMNAVLGFSEMIEMQIYGPLGDARYREYIGHVRRSGRLVFDLMSEILELSQAESGTLELARSPVDVACLVAAAVEESAENAKVRGVSVSVEPIGALPPFSADAGKLRRALGSLLSNAVRFTPKGGSITVAVAAQADAWVTIRVSDTGIGMDAATLARALQPFGRLDSPLIRQHAGVGVGLPLTKRIAELHGGRLDLDSVPDKGTTVRMILPVTRAAAAPEAGMADAGPALERNTGRGG